MPTSSPATATDRTLRIWLLTNLGGTGWLVLDFCRDSPSDVAVPLMSGLVAGAIAVLGFSMGNYLLLNLLPIGPVSSLLSISRPYLGAALLAVAWLYRPQPALKPAKSASHPAPVRISTNAMHSSWAELAG